MVGRQGRTAADGQRIFLEAARLGHKLVTSRQAIARLAERLAQRTEAVTAQPNKMATGTDSVARNDLQWHGFFT